MKQIIFLISLAFFINANSFSQEGISFSDADWFEILATAKKENKVIFMDAYTTWCGPCKKMSRSTFTDKKVGEFYNANFINVKKDMEKGEGIQLAKEYNVRAYPTLLFIDGDGKIAHRAVGFLNAEEFLDLGNLANDPTKRLSALDEKYAAGNKNAEFLYEYAKVKYNAMDPAYALIGEDYMKTQEEWGTKENMKFIFQFADNSESVLFDYLIKNRMAFVEEFGERAIERKIQNIVNQELAMAEGDKVLERAKKIFPKIYPEKGAYMYSQFKLTYFRQMEEGDNFAKAAIEHYKKFTPKNGDELNNVAWTIYETVDNKKYLKHALKWAKKSVKLEDNYYNNDTVAAVYFKLGKKGKAEKIALRAIELAKSENEDYSLTEELLQKIREN